jgi:hypothetical protein
MTRDELQSVYEDLLIQANCFELLPYEASASESLISKLIHEGRLSEQRENHLAGFFQDRSDQELLEIVRERLGKHRPLAFSVEMLFRDVEQAADEYEWSSRTSVYAGQFPTGLFNAQAVGVADGALLLINTGLMMFIYQCAKLLFLNVQLTLHDDAGAQHGSVSQQMTNAEIIEALSDIILAYRFRRNSTFATRFPFESGLRGLLTATLAQSAERFVLAHEYGHAIAGHLTGGRAVRQIVTDNGLRIELLSKSWEEEIEADLYGAHLVLPPSKRTIDSEGALQPLGFRLAGPLFFFALDDLISTIDETIFGRGGAEITDHPPASMRIDAIQMWYESIGVSGKLLQLATFPAHWISEFSDPVCEYIQVGLRERSLG